MTADNPAAQNATQADPYTTLLPREIVAERVFDAPRELVFRAWTEAEHLRQWWGPTGWLVPHITVDLRPGGKWHYCMQGPEDAGEWAGVQSWGLGTYQEIVPNERIVYVDAFSDAEGNVNEQMPLSYITVEFHDHNGQTRVVSRTRYDTEEQLQAIVKMGAVEGFTQTMDRLEGYLKQLQA